MEREERDLEIIEQYLKGELTGDEHKEVEARLISDDEFRKLKEEYSGLIEGIEFAGKNETFSRLQSLEQTLPPVNPGAKIVPIYRSPKAMGIAASIGILLISAYFLLLRSSFDHLATFEEHFEIYPNVIAPSTRSTEENESLKARAYFAYDQGQFHEAIELFKNTPEDDDQGAVMLYLGVSYLGINENDMATDSFEKYLKTDFELFLPQVYWYLGLAHLKQGNFDQVKKVWAAIPHDNPYRQKADRIMADM